LETGKEERSSFLKKGGARVARSKKRWFLEARGAATRAQECESFWVLFFKKEHLA